MGTQYKEALIEQFTEFIGTTNQKSPSGCHVNPFEHMSTSDGHVGKCDTTNKKLQQETEALQRVKAELELVQETKKMQKSMLKFWRCI